MKKIIALGFGAFLAQGAMAQAAKSLPTLPDDCADQIASNGYYCSSNPEASINGNKITVTFAAVVNKSAFGIEVPATETDAVAFEEKAIADSLLTRYSDFASWPEFAAASKDQKVIEFAKNGSKALSSIENADGSVTLRHVYDYSLKVQGIPLLKTPVKGTTYNTVLLTPYEGAIASLEFDARTTIKADEVAASGLKSQVGSIHAISCAEGSALCDSSKVLLVYTTVVEPATTLLPKVAANTVSAGIEDLLIGLLEEFAVAE